MAAFRHLGSGAVLHLLPGDPARGLAPFLIGRTPLRQEEWDRIGGEDARGHRDPDAPVGGVSWLAAQAWLARAGGGLRLPREAEWEYACRAGAGTAYWWGEVIDPERCWYYANSGGRVHAVSEHVHAANAFGLVDVAGNVREWCEEDLDVPMEGSAWQEGNPGKVTRGGSYETPSLRCRADHRDGSDPRATYPDLGLRIAASIPLARVECG